METAAKKKNSLALGVIASMIVLVSTLVLGSAASASSSSRTSPTTASPSHVVALKSRVEIFFASPGKSVELLAVNLVNATRYYDSLDGVVLECLVAPVKTVDMMAETGQLGGKLYGSEKLGKLQRYLERRGIAMDPARNGSFDGVKGIMELPPNATVLNVRHELSHMLDFKKYGPDYYKKFNSFDREEMVLDRLMNNRVWNNLNEGEKSWSLLYPFTRKGGQAW